MKELVMQIIRILGIYIINILFIGNLIADPSDMSLPSSASTQPNNSQQDSATLSAIVNQKMYRNIMDEKPQKASIVYNSISTDDSNAAKEDEKNSITNNTSTPTTPENSEESNDDNQTEGPKEDENLTPEVPDLPPEEPEEPIIKEEVPAPPPPEEVVEKKEDNKLNASDIFTGIAIGSGALAAAGAAAAGGAFIYDKLFGGNKKPEKPEENTGVSIDEGLFNKSPTKIDSRSIDFSGAEEEVYVKKSDAAEQMEKGSSFAEKVLNTEPVYGSLVSQEEGADKVPEDTGKGSSLKDKVSDAWSDFKDLFSKKEKEDKVPEDTGKGSSLKDKVSDAWSSFKDLFSKKETDDKVPEKGGALTNEDLLKYLSNSQGEEGKKSGTFIGEFLSNNAGTIIAGIGGLTATSISSAAIAYFLKKNESGESGGILDSLKSLIGIGGNKNDKDDSITSNGTVNNTEKPSEDGFGFDSPGFSESGGSGSTGEGSFDMNDEDGDKDFSFGDILDKIFKDDEKDEDKNKDNDKNNDKEVQVESGYNIDQLKKLVEKNGIEASEEVIHKVLSKRPVTQDELLTTLKQFSVENPERFVPQNTIDHENLSKIVKELTGQTLTKDAFIALTGGAAVLSVEKAREFLIKTEPSLAGVVDKFIKDQDTTVSEERAKEILKEALGDRYKEENADIMLQQRHSISKADCEDFLNAVIDEQEAQNKLNNSSGSQSPNKNPSEELDGNRPNNNAEKPGKEPNGDTGFFLDYSTGIFNFYDGSTSNNNKPNGEESDGKAPGNNVQEDQNGNSQKRPGRTDFVDLDGLPLNGNAGKGNIEDKESFGDGSFGVGNSGNNQQNTGNQGSFGDKSFGMESSGGKGENYNNINNSFIMAGGAGFLGSNLNNNSFNMSGGFGSTNDDSFNMSGGFGSTNDDSFNMSGGFGSTNDDSFNMSGGFGSTNDDSFNMSGGFGSTNDDSFNMSGSFGSPSDDSFNMSGSFGSPSDDSFNMSGGFGSPSNTGKDSSSIWDIFGFGNKNSSSNSFGFNNNSFGFPNTNQSSSISSNKLLGLGAGALGIGAIATLLYGNKDAIKESFNNGALSGVKDFASDIGGGLLSFAKENKTLTLAGALGVGALGLKFLSNSSSNSNSNSNKYNQSFGFSSMYGNSSYGTGNIFGGYSAPLTEYQTYGLAAGVAGLLTTGWGIYDTYKTNKELDKKQEEADKKVLETIDPVRKLMNNSKTAVDETMVKIGDLYANKLNSVKVPYEQAKEEMASATTNREKAEQALADAQERLKSVPDKYKAQARAEVEEAKKALNTAKKEENNAKKHFEEKKKAYNSIIDIADREEAVNAAEKQVNDIQSKLDIVTSKEEELKKAEEELKKAAPQDKEAAAEKYYKIKSEYSALGVTSASLNLDLVKAQNSLENAKKDHANTKQVSDILDRIAKAEAGLPDTQHELDTAHQELAKTIENNNIDIKLSGTEKKELDSHKRELDSAKEQHKSSEETFNMAVEDTAAIKELRKALEADPNNEGLKAKLAAAQAELKEKAQNLNDLENQIAKNPKDTELQKEYDKAKEEFQNAIKSESQGKKESYLNLKTIGGTLGALAGGLVFSKTGFSNTYAGGSLPSGSAFSGFLGGDPTLRGGSLPSGGSLPAGGSSLLDGLLGGNHFLGDGYYKDTKGLLYSYNSPTGIINSTTGIGAVLAGLGGLTMLTDKMYDDAKKDKADKKQEENTKKIVDSLEYNRGNKTAADQEVEKAKSELGNFYSEKLESVRGPYYKAKNELEDAKDKAAQAKEDLEKAKTRLENAPPEFKNEARAALAEAEKDLELANNRVGEAEENFNTASKAFDDMTGIPNKEKALESAKKSLEEAHEKLEMINDAEERMREAEKNMDNADPSEIKEATAEYYKAKEAYDKLKGDKDKLKDDVKKYGDALDTAQKDYDNAKKLGDALEAVNAAEENLPESAAELEQAKKDLYESIKDGSTNVKLSEKDKKGLKELENKLTDAQSKQEEHSKALESSVDQFGKVAEAKKAHEADPDNPVLKAKYESLKEEAMSKVNKLNSAEQKLKDNPGDKAAQVEYDIAKKAVSDIAVAPEEKADEKKGLDVTLFGKKVNISADKVGKALAVAGAGVAALGITKGMGTFNSVGLGEILFGKKSGTGTGGMSMGGMGGMGSMGGMGTGGMGTGGMGNTDSSGGMSSKVLGAVGAVGGLGVAAIGVKGLLSGEKDLGTIGATVLGGGAAIWGATKMLGIGSKDNKVEDAEKRVQAANGGLMGGGSFSGMQSPGIQSPGMQSPGIQSPGIQSPGMQSPGMQSPGMQSPGIQSPDIQSPGMQPSTPLRANEDEETLIKAGKVTMSKPVTLKEENGVVKKIETYNIGGKEVEYVRGEASVGLPGMARTFDSKNDFKKHGTFVRDEFHTDNRGNITVHHVYKSGDNEVRDVQSISQKKLMNKYNFDPVGDPVLRADGNGNVMAVRKFTRNGQTFEDIKPAEKDDLLNLSYEDVDQSAEINESKELDRKISDLKKAPKNNAKLISTLEKRQEELKKVEASKRAEQIKQMKKNTRLEEVNGQVMVVNDTLGANGETIQEARPANDSRKITNLFIKKDDFTKHGFKEVGERQLKKGDDGKVMVVKTFTDKDGNTLTHATPAKEGGLLSKSDLKKYGNKTKEFKANEKGKLEVHTVYKDMNGNEVLRKSEEVSHDDLIKKHNFTPEPPVLRKDADGNMMVVKKIHGGDDQTFETTSPATKDQIMNLHYEDEPSMDPDEELTRKISDLKEIHSKKTLMTKANDALMGNTKTGDTIKALEKEQQNRARNKAKNKEAEAAIEKANNEVSKHKKELASLQKEAQEVAQEVQKAQELNDQKRHLVEQRQALQKEVAKINAKREPLHDLIVKTKELERRVKDNNVPETERKSMEATIQANNDKITKLKEQLEGDYTKHDLEVKKIKARIEKTEKNLADSGISLEEMAKITEDSVNAEQKEIDAQTAKVVKRAVEAKNNLEKAKKDKKALQKKLGIEDDDTTDADSLAMAQRAAMQGAKSGASSSSLDNYGQSLIKPSSISLGELSNSGEDKRQYSDSKHKNWYQEHYDDMVKNHIKTLNETAGHSVTDFQKSGSEEQKAILSKYNSAITETEKNIADKEKELITQQKKQKDIEESVKVLQKKLEENPDEKNIKNELEKAKNELELQKQIVGEYQYAIHDAKIDVAKAKDKYDQLVVAHDPKAFENSKNDLDKKEKELKDKKKEIDKEQQDLEKLVKDPKALEKKIQSTNEQIAEIDKKLAGPLTQDEKNKLDKEKARLTADNKIRAERMDKVKSLAEQAAELDKGLKDVDSQKKELNNREANAKQKVEDAKQEELKKAQKPSNTGEGAGTNNPSSNTGSATSNKENNGTPSSQDGSTGSSSENNSTKESAPTLESMANGSSSGNVSGNSNNTSNKSESSSLADMAAGNTTSQNTNKPQSSTPSGGTGSNNPVPGQNFGDNVNNTPSLNTGQGALGGAMQDSPTLSGGSGGRDWKSTLLNGIMGVGAVGASLGVAGFGVYKLVDRIKELISGKDPELDELAKRGEEFSNRAGAIQEKYGEGLEGALNAIKTSFNVDIDGMIKKVKEGVPLSDEEKKSLEDPKLKEHIQKNIEGRYDIDVLGLFSEYSDFHENASKILKDSVAKKNSELNIAKLSEDSKAKNALAYVAGMASELGYDNFREVIEAIQSGEGDKHKEDITKMLADPKLKEILNSVKDNPEYSNMDFSAIMSPHVDMEGQKATEAKAKETEEESNKVKEEMSKLQDEIMDLNINDEEVKKAGDILSSSENLKNIDTKALFDEINKNGINSAIEKGLITEDQLKEISGNKEIMKALADECPNIKTVLEKSQEILDKSKTALMIKPSKVAEEIEKSLAEGKVENGEELLKKEQQGIQLTADEEESLSLYKAQKEVGDLLKKMKNGEVITTEDHEKAYSSILKALPEEDATKLNSEIDRYLTEIRAETDKVTKAKKEEQAKLEEKISDLKGELKTATVPLDDKEKAKDIMGKYPELKDVDIDKLIADIKSGDLKEEDIKNITGNDALMKELAAESPTFADLVMKADDVINKTAEATKVEPNASAKEVLSGIEEKLNDKDNPLTEEQKKAYTPEVKQILDDMKAGKVVDPELVKKNEENIKNIAEALGMDPEKLLNECKEYSDKSQEALENMKSETNSAAVEKLNSLEEKGEKEEKLVESSIPEEAKIDTSKSSASTENVVAKDTNALFDPRVSSGSPAADAISDKKFGTGNLSASDKANVSGVVSGVKSLDELNKDLDKLSEGLKDSDGNPIKLSDVVKKVADGTISPAEVSEIIANPELKQKLEDTFKQHGMENILDEMKTFADKADDAKEAGQHFKEKVSSSSALRQDLTDIKNKYGIDAKDILNKLADGTATPEEIKKITDNPDLLREIKKVCQKHGLEDVSKAVEDFNKPYTKESTSKAAKDFNDVINKSEPLSNAVNDLKNKTGVDLKDVMQKIEKGTLTPAEAKAVMSDPGVASAIKDLCEKNGLGEAYRSLNSISNAFDKNAAADSASNFLKAAKESSDLHNSIKSVGNKHGVDVVDIIDKISKGEATDEDIKKITDNPKLKAELKKTLTEKGFGDVYASIENVNKPKVAPLDKVKASNALDKISEDVGVDIKNVLDAIHNGEGPNYKDLSAIINNPEILQKLKDAEGVIGTDVASILGKYKDDVDEHAKKVDKVKAKELYGDKDIEKVLGNPDLVKNLDDVYKVDGAKVTDLLEKMANGEEVSKEDIDKFLQDPDIKAQLETIDNVRGTNIVDSLEKYPENRRQKEIEQKNRASKSIGNLLLNGGPNGGMHNELLEIDMKLNKMEPRISEMLKDIVSGNPEKHLDRIDQILNSNEPEFQNARDVLKQVSDKYGLDVTMVLDNTLNNSAELKKLANDKLNEQKATKIKELYGDKKAQDVLTQINSSGSAGIAWSQLEGMDEVKDLLTRMSNGETISEEEINKIQNDENLSEKISKFEKASNIKLNELFDNYNPVRDEKIKSYQKEVAAEEMKKLMYTSDGDVHPGLAVAAIQLSDYGISDLSKIIDDINAGSLDVDTYNMLRENILDNPEVEQKLDRINDLYGVDLRTIFEYGETSYLEKSHAEKAEREKVLNDPRAVAIVNKIDTEGKFKGVINGIKGIYGVDITGLLSRMAAGDEISEEEIKTVLGNKQLLDELKETDKTHGTEIVSTFNNYIKDREMRELGFKDRENSEKIKDILTNSSDAISHADTILKRHGISMTEVLNGIMGDNPHLYEGQISQLLDPENEEMSKIVESIESEYGIDLKSVLEFGKEKIEKTDPVSYVGGHLRDMRAKVALEQMAGTNTEVILSAYTQKYDINVHELFQRMAEGEEISEEEIKRVTENPTLYKELGALSLSSGIDFHGILETYTEDRKTRDYLKKKSDADKEMSKLIPDKGSVHGGVAYANVLMDEHMDKYGINFEDLLRDIKSGDLKKHEGTLNELLNNPTAMTILKETDAAHGSNMVSVLESAKETIEFNDRESKVEEMKKHEALTLDFAGLNALDRKQVHDKLDAVKLGTDGHTLKTLIDNISKGMMPGATDGDRERYEHAVATIKENGLLNEETTVGKQFLTIIRNIDEGYGTYIENSLNEHVNSTRKEMLDKVELPSTPPPSTKLPLAFPYFDNIPPEKHEEVNRRLAELSVGSSNMQEIMEDLSKGEGSAEYDKALTVLKESGMLENEEFMESIRKIDEEHGGFIENFLNIAKTPLPQEEKKENNEGEKAQKATAYDPMQNLSPHVRSFIEDLQSQINKLEMDMYQSQYNAENSENNSKEKESVEEVSPAVKKIIEDLEAKVNKLEMNLHETRSTIEEFKDITKETEPINPEHLIADPKFMEELGKQLVEQFNHERGSTTEIPHEHAAKHNTKRAQESHAKGGSTNTGSSSSAAAA